MLHDLKQLQTDMEDLEVGVAGNGDGLEQNVCQGQNLPHQIILYY